LWRNEIIRPTKKSIVMISNQQSTLPRNVHQVKARHIFGIGERHRTMGPRFFFLVPHKSWLYHLIRAQVLLWWKGTIRLLKKQLVVISNQQSTLPVLFQTKLSLRSWRWVFPPLQQYAKSE
jgi:hypothetical protein